jgi:hypothetical protein
MRKNRGNTKQGQKLQNKKYRPKNWKLRLTSDMEAFLARKAKENPLAMKPADRL